MIVPDGITPKSAWRAWGFDGTHILSMRGDVWKPGEAMEAACPHMEAGTRPFQTMGSASLMTPYQDEGLVRDGRKAWLASHGVPNALVSSYDVDRGERYVPFGKVSRLWIPNLVSDVKPTAPGDQCSCGIYATNALATARHYVQSAPGRPSMSAPLGNHGVGILGRVALWGRVVIHADGYRAQYAYPQSFFTDDESVKEALAKYNVPILSTKELPTSEHNGELLAVGGTALTGNSQTMGTVATMNSFISGTIIPMPNVPRATLADRFWRLPDWAIAVVILLPLFFVLSLLLNR